MGRRYERMMDPGDLAVVYPPDEGPSRAFLIVDVHKKGDDDIVILDMTFQELEKMGWTYGEDKSERDGYLKFDSRLLEFGYERRDNED